VDAYGNNITTIATAQLEQNAPGAIVTIGAYGIVAGILKHFGM
jgi:hypothetical protein